MKKTIFILMGLGLNFGCFSWLSYQYAVQYFVGHGELLLVDYSPVLFLEICLNIFLTAFNLWLAYSTLKTRSYKK